MDQLTPRTPRYLEVAQALASEIAPLPPNAPLPTEQQFAKRFAVSRVTIRRALGLLERSGRITRRRGRGTAVSPRKITRQIVPVCTIEEDLRAQGLKLETKVLAYRVHVLPSDHVRAALRLPAGRRVGVLTLVRSVNDQVIAHDERYLPAWLAARFDTTLIQGQAVSDILRDMSGQSLTMSQWETEIVPASMPVAQALGIVPGVLVLMNTFREYFADGRPAEVGIMSYRIDLVKFSFSAPGPSNATRAPLAAANRRESH